MECRKYRGTRVSPWSPGVSPWGNTQYMWMAKQRRWADRLADFLPSKAQSWLLVECFFLNRKDSWCFCFFLGMMCNQYIKGSYSMVFDLPGVGFVEKVWVLCWIFCLYNTISCLTILNCHSESWWIGVWAICCTFSNYLKHSKLQVCCNFVGCGIWTQFVIDGRSFAVIINQYIYIYTHWNYLCIGWFCL